jgi:hypothetical protein
VGGEEGNMNEKMAKRVIACEPRLASDPIGRQKEGTKFDRVKQIETSKISQRWRQD